MGLEFIKRIIRTTAILSLIVALALAVYHDGTFAFGFLVGTAWGLANLFAIRLLVAELINPAGARRKMILPVALVKFPVLYVGGYLVLASEAFSVLSLLAGFSLMFVVIILKVLGRLYLGLDTFGFPLRQREAKR